MKSFNKAVLVSSMVFVFSGVAMANDAVKNSQYQNIAKRSYLQVSPSNKPSHLGDWEGATLLESAQVKHSGMQNAVDIRKINLHMLAKRPYM
jgi:hypothetical protein